MNTQRVIYAVLLVPLIVSIAHAQGFGALRGTIHDPSGAVVPDTTVTLKATSSSWSQTAVTDTVGAFSITAIPMGQYTIEARHDGFATVHQSIQVMIGSAPNVDLTLPMSSTSTEVTAVAEAPLEVTAPEAASPPVLVSRQDIIEGLPGADRMSSLQFITETTPGAFVLHDHLHVRGGHQINWSIDGVPIPNTNMSSNVGRAMDPKDIEEVQINRGGYGAQSGDRTFAQVNILTRSGLDFGNDADLTLTYGSFHQTNDQFGFGGHTERFAYYASLVGNRTDLGLEPPTEQIIHNMGNGQGFFTNMSYKAGASDDLRWTFSFRNDHFQIPNFLEEQAAGYRDIDQERDSFATFNWVHTISANTLLTVSPFFHYNNSRYTGGPTDPLIAMSRNRSNYVGSQIELSNMHGPSNLTAGVYGFYQQNNLLFSLTDTNASQSTSAGPMGGVGAAYINDQYKIGNWLTLNGGVRTTYFSGIAAEKATNPRAGATVVVPKLNWVVRSYYGKYYQPPPLYTVGGGIFGFELLQGAGLFGFSPLKGERDIQREAGLTIPVHGWVFDFDHFSTSARDFLDHNVLGNSNILLPLTTPYARLRGTEAVVRSPFVIHRLRFHLAYSNMTAQFKGAPIGGLILPVSNECTASYCFLDHDQRNTLSTGGSVQIPWHSWFSANVVYGSGVLKGDGPDHLPPHTTADVMFGKTIGEWWSAGLTILNVSNSRYPFDVNSSFAGTHFNNPREIIGSLRYRFHM